VFFRLDNLDTYSNLLYVKEQRVELAHLAHKTVEIDKFRTETCCVVGNYYSLRYIKVLLTNQFVLWPMSINHLFNPQRLEF
jgi:hypothetical protein